ncbi:hypothetical protein H5410_014988, partial [Solanum commersonii]
MHTPILKLLMHRSTVYSKIQVVTHHYKDSHALKNPKSDATLTLNKKNIVHLTQDHKGLSKACNGAECKGM